MVKKILIYIVGIITVVLTTVNANAQHPMPATVINGEVCDSLTRQPLPFVAIFLRGSDRGTMTDENGKFSITTSVNFISLELSTMGYTTKNVYVNKGERNDITVEMVPSGVTLNELVVKPKKEKYSKKNNPAVDFVKKLMARKQDFNPKNHDYYNYDKYEKITMGLNNFSASKKKSWLKGKFKFIYDYLDTSEVSGKPILTVSVKEKVSDCHFRRSPESAKEVVRGIKRAGIDDAFDQESVQRFLEDVFREIDIFGNDVPMMQNRFVSPLSRIGVDYYKYYLSDTIDVDGVKCIELSFSPFTPESFGFLGRIYVPLNDSTLFIKRVKLNVPKSINLNYVESITMIQDFVKATDGSRLKVRDDMTVEFKIVPGSQGLYARRTTAYANHNFDAPADMEVFHNEAKTIVNTDAEFMPDEFWKENRQVPIKDKENAIKTMLARLREVPLFYWTEKIITVLVSGYIPTSKDSKFDFGPMNTTVSGNAVEGMRFRVGGMTTANLSKHWFARGYMAYGLKDEKMKYNGELEYSFNEKKYHSREFPVHSLKLTHKYDVDQLGQHYFFTNMDNVFLALKRKEDNKMTYLRKTCFDYTLEMENGFSVQLGFEHDIQEATRYLPFIDGYGNVFRNYKEAMFNVTLRYAPGEKFYQTKSYRIPINLDAPVFTLTHTYAPKGFFGSMYTVNKTELSIQKRFWFSAFGYTDIILKAGKVWSEVSYPNLLLPNANLSYTIQPESYPLMNAMEFANDQYLSWDFTYWANGAILNRIPILKYLKLREAFSFRGLYGKLKDSNNPEYNNDLFRFPVSANCKPMGKVPYMEAGVGFDNIFTILRVDYVWRLTYRNTPGVDKSGLRIQLHFTF